MNESYHIPYKILRDSEWNPETLKYKSDIEKDKSQRIPLKDLVIINPDRINKKDFKNSNQKFRYAEIKSVNTETNFIGKYNNYEASELPKRATLKAKKHDILFPKIRPESGAVAYVNKECIVSNTLTVLRPRKGISSRLLYLILTSKRVIEDLGKLSKGSVIPSLTLKDIKNYYLPLNEYPKNKEKKAVDLFDRWVQLNMVNKNLKYIVDKVLNENIFTNKNISQHKLDTFIEIKSPQKSYKEKLKKDDEPVIKTKHLEENKLYLDLKKIKKKYWDSISLYKNEDFIKYNWIILPKTISKIKAANLVPREATGALLDKYMYAIETKEDLIPEYLLILFKSSWFNNQLDFDKRTINKKNIRNLEIPVPKIKLQEKIIKEIKENSYIIETQTQKEKIKTFQEKLLE